nr:GTP cyclohydrolase MptA [Candidatus Sigynarchaeota archaeon]
MAHRFRRDIQSEQNEFSVGIDKVGLVDVKKRIEITRKDGTYALNLAIKAFINLPATQRGAHMSRSVESIDEYITEHVYMPKNNVEEFGVDIAKTLLEKHAYADHVHVELEGPLIVQMRSHDDKGSTQSAYYIKVAVQARRTELGNPAVEIYLTAVAEGMIACPCGQEMSKEFSKDLLMGRNDINIDEQTIDKILSLIPVATHNQRATGTITVQVPSPGTVDVLDLVNIIEGSMSGRICGILKRPDEAHLIRLVHQDPLFSEDVLRRMAWNMAGERLARVPGHMVVELAIVSMESIHPHSVSASTKTTMQALRDIKERGASPADTIPR